MHIRMLTPLMVGLSWALVACPGGSSTPSDSTTGNKTTYEISGQVFDDAGTSLASSKIKIIESVKNNTGITYKVLSQLDTDLLGKFSVKIEKPVGEISIVAETSDMIGRIKNISLNQDKINAGKIIISKGKIITGTVRNYVSGLGESQIQIGELDIKVSSNSDGSFKLYGLPGELALNISNSKGVSINLTTNPNLRNEEDLGIIFMYKEFDNRPYVTRIRSEKARRGEKIYIDGINFSNTNEISIGGVGLNKFEVASPKLIKGLIHQRTPLSHRKLEIISGSGISKPIQINILPSLYKVVEPGLDAWYAVNNQGGISSWGSAFSGLDEFRNVRYLKSVDNMMSLSNNWMFAIDNEGKILQINYKPRWTAPNNSGPTASVATDFKTGLSLGVDGRVIDWFPNRIYPETYATMISADGAELEHAVIVNGNTGEIWNRGKVWGATIEPNYHETLKDKYIIAAEAGATFDVYLDYYGKMRYIGLRNAKSESLDDFYNSLISKFDDEGIVDISLAQSSIIALRRDGTLIHYNPFAKEMQRQSEGLKNIVQISSANKWAMAISEDGTVYKIDAFSGDVAILDFPSGLSALKPYDSW